MKFWAKEAWWTAGPQPVLLLLRFPLRGTAQQGCGYFMTSCGLRRKEGRGPSPSCPPGERTAAAPKCTNCRYESRKNVQSLFPPLPLCWAWQWSRQAPGSSLALLVLGPKALLILWRGCGGKWSMALRGTAAQGEEDPENRERSPASETAAVLSSDWNKWSQFSGSFR